MALVLLEWTVGLTGISAWSQSWSVIRRGYFRINAWTAVVLAVLSVVTYRAAGGGTGGTATVLVYATAALTAVYLAVQSARTDAPGTIAGYAAAAVGSAALVTAAGSIERWPVWLGALELLSGAALTGAVTNGMLLGHWYLNQPGLKTWALARMTGLTLAACGAAGLLGLAAYGRLSSAETPGAVLGLPFGRSFGAAFYLTWVLLVAFTGAVALGARRCVAIRSIQSATGLYYVALLTAGVAEFLVRYLMVNAS